MWNNPIKEPGYYWITRQWHPKRLYEVARVEHRYGCEIWYTCFSYVDGYKCIIYFSDTILSKDRITNIERSSRSEFESVYSEDIQKEKLRLDGYRLVKGNRNRDEGCLNHPKANTKRSPV